MISKLIETFYNKDYEKTIKYLSSRYKLSIEDAEDIVQEALIKIIKSNVDTKGFKQYLNSIIHNEVINYIDKANKGKRIKPFDIKELKDYQLNNLVDNSVSVEDTVINKEIIVKVSNELELFVRGYSYIEIAEIKKISIGAVKNRIHKQRKIIKNGN